MEDERVQRIRVSGERGHGALAYIVVTGSLSLLVLQPSLIVAAVDRLSVFLRLLLGKLGQVF